MYNAGMNLPQRAANAATLFAIKSILSLMPPPNIKALR